MARRLLLISNSTQHGSGYLDHCAAAIEEILAGGGEALFVPYALADRDRYAATARARFAAMGLRLDSIHEAPDPRAAAAGAAAFFVGGGNTFRLLKTLQDLGLVGIVRERVAAGAPYIGSSAGTNLACPTIRTTNDMPIVQPAGFDAFGLIPFQINPHYLDPDPSSTHKGETREQRIAEYLEENDLPVLGLREGAWLRVEGSQATLHGLAAARLFRRGRAPEEVAAGSRLDALLT